MTNQFIPSAYFPNSYQPKRPIYVQFAHMIPPERILYDEMHYIYNDEWRKTMYGYLSYEESKRSEPCVYSYTLTSKFACAILNQNTLLIYDFTFKEKSAAAKVSVPLWREEDLVTPNIQ